MTDNGKPGPKQPDSSSGNGLDPDIADLLAIEPDDGTGAPAAGGPDFSSLFGEEKKKDAAASAGPVDTTKKRFETIVNIEEAPKPFFNDPNFYKTLLAGEGDVATRVHDLLSKFLKVTEPEEKSMYRSKLVSAFWELGGNIAGKIGKELPIPKRLCLRFGILSPTLLSTELRDMVSRVVFTNRTGEPVYYLDEWLDAIAKGTVRPSSTDETKSVKKEVGQKMQETVEKKQGQRQAEMTVLSNKVAQLDEREAGLRGQVERLLKHQIRERFGNLKAPFSGEQKAAMTEIQESLRSLGILDAQIKESYDTLEDIDKELEVLGRKMEGVKTDSAVDSKTVVSEHGCVRQMAKMSCGRKGNHFPIMVTQFVRPQIKEIATRENAINAMAQVEAMDPGLFLRTFKNQTTRIVPNVILIPGYGDQGLCWEPFEKFNRSTSRGRIAIPMYPKNLIVSVLMALADLRWQVAKEKASYYWMEEGLTGKYYQWFDGAKLKGDVREYFIRDYMLWITKESQGMQKLDREVRGIFWRNMPFPQPIKDNLRNRGFVYNELYKKDANIAASDGY